jgi:hypothetical protein
MSLLSARTTFLRPKWSESKANTIWPITAATEGAILIAVTEEDANSPSLSGLYTYPNITMIRFTAKSW